MDLKGPVDPIQASINRSTFNRLRGTYLVPRSPKSHYPQFPDRTTSVEASPLFLFLCSAFVGDLFLAPFQYMGVKRGRKGRTKTELLT